MKLINGLYGDSTLLEFILKKLRQGGGNYLTIGVGSFSGDEKVIADLSGGLRSWLSATPERKACIYIGDWRSVVNPIAQAPDERTIVRGVGMLLGVLGELRDQVNVVFVPELHAKFYTMWTLSKSESDTTLCALEWASIGSSNISKAALREQNIELDVIFESSSDAPPSFVSELRQFINGLVDQMSDDTELESLLDQILDDYRDQEQRLREQQMRNADQQMNEARAESNRIQDIGPPGP